MRAARKAAKEQEEFLLRTKGISIRQKEVPEGVDPKTILCEYFKHGCCAKSADRCKFSHKMPDASRSGGSDATRKRDIYEDDEADEGDTMELWDQAKLESVIAKKHGAEKASSNATDIVRARFLARPETRKYGWFWACPGGDACKYKHKLPKVRVQVRALGRDDARGGAEPQVGSGRPEGGAEKLKDLRRARP